MLYANLRNHLLLWLSVLSVLIGLSGCAVSTRDGLTADIQSQLGAIALPEPTSREAQLFNMRFDDNLISPSHDKKYQLSYQFSETDSLQLSVKGSNSTLVNSSMIIRFQLTEIMTEDVLLTDTVEASAVSGTVSSYYGQRKSQQFISERLAGRLAERVIDRISLFFVASGS